MTDDLQVPKYELVEVAEEDDYSYDVLLHTLDLIDYILEREYLPKELRVHARTLREPIEAMTKEYEGLQWLH